MTQSARRGRVAPVTEQPLPGGALILGNDMPIVVFNQKGGVGKSTITCNLAAISAAQGVRTLVIDLDPQGNSSNYLQGDTAQPAQPTVASFFEQTLSYSFKSVPATIGVSTCAAIENV